jgi:hypothetical protein
MNKKLTPFLLLLILALLVFILRRCSGDVSNERGEKKSGQNIPAKKRGFNRNVQQLEYTAHALCRMDCRKISGADVKEIMQVGKINYRKSDLQDKPCPTYALEGYTNENEHLRIVFAQCNEKTKVVTTINLDEEVECHCPGDENKVKR